QHEGELRLLLGRLRRGASGGTRCRASGHGDGGGGGNAPLLLEHLHQLSRLHDGERRQLVGNCVQVSHESSVLLTARCLQRSKMLKSVRFLGRTAATRPSPTSP